MLQPVLSVHGDSVLTLVLRLGAAKVWIWGVLLALRSRINILNASRLFSVTNVQIYRLLNMDTSNQLLYRRTAFNM